MGQSGVNSLVVIVTAPDGITRQTYVVSYTYRHGTQWYVAQGGSDSTGYGTADSPFASVAQALTAISSIYSGGSGWPGTAVTPVAAQINISGTITASGTGSYTGSDEMIKADGSIGTGLPPIILAGSNIATDKISANPSKRRLSITTAAVILEDGLTLTGGNISSGGGVYVDTGGTFNMNGGSITGNTTANYGGGVLVYISTFTMSGGRISGNTADTVGGGVRVEGSGSTFTMSGGSISGNTASSGSGVSLGMTGAFTMSGSAAVDTGNPVGLSPGAVITLSGALTANPAANIEITVVPGTFVLGGSHITTDDNYKKFWLNGVSNENGDKIGSDGKILP